MIRGRYSSAHWKRLWSHLPPFLERFLCGNSSSTTTWELRSRTAEVALCSDSAERGEMAVKSLCLTVDSKLVSRAVREGWRNLGKVIAYQENETGGRIRGKEGE